MTTRKIPGPGRGDSAQWISGPARLRMLLALLAFAAAAAVLAACSSSATSSAGGSGARGGPAALSGEVLGCPRRCAQFPRVSRDPRARRMAAVSKCGPLPAPFHAGARHDYTEWPGWWR